MIEPQFKLRPVTPEDEAFLLRLYESTRAAELALVPWTAAQREFFVSLQANAQRQHYRAQCPAAEELLILLDEQPAGRLYIDRRATELRLLDFTLLPEHYASPAGPQLLRTLMAEAAAADLAVTIHLQPGDPLQALFEQLSFAPVGNNGIHVLFEWRAAS